MEIEYLKAFISLPNLFHQRAVKILSVQASKGCLDLVSWPDAKGSGLGQRGHHSLSGLVI